VPRKAQLSREQVLDAAVALVDREGIGALTIRDVARELGASPMALYYHIPDKEALVEGIGERLLAGVALTPAGGWDERARDLVRQLRLLSRRHPNVLPLVFAQRFHSPTALRPFEDLMRALREAGFPPPDALVAMRTLVAYAVGAALMEPGGPASGTGTGGRADFVRRFAALPRDEFPFLVEVGEETGRIGPDEEFDRGLDAILAGLREEPRAGGA